MLLEWADWCTIEMPKKIFFCIYSYKQLQMFVSVYMKWQYEGSSYTVIQGLKLMKTMPYSNISSKIARVFSSS